MENRMFITGERLLSLINCPESATFEEIQTLARNIIAYRRDQDQCYNRTAEIFAKKDAMRSSTYAGSMY